MIVLAIVVGMLGIAMVMQMIAWAVGIWKDATEEERKIKRFEKFSKMMKDTDLKSWK